MKLDIFYLLAACVACTLATAPAKKPTSHGVLKNDSPIKREASVSSGSGYHGPSYKYLPPSSPSASSGGYDSYSSGPHSSYAGGFGAYNVGGLSNAAGHGHDIGHFGVTGGGQKVETFIVETQPVHVDEGISHGVSGYGHDGASSTFSGGYSGTQSEYDSGYAHGHGVVHKIMPILGPLRGYTPTGSHTSSGFSHYGGSGSNFRHYKGLSSAAHSLSGSSPIYVRGSGSSAGNSYGNKHGVLGPVRNYGGLHTVGIGSASSYGPKNHDHHDHHDHGSSAHFHSPLESAYRESGYSGDQGGYSYEAPVHHDVQHIPTTSYGVPITDLSPPYHQHNEPVDINVQQLPSYSAGHKGLGHFGFTASRPQALHTDYIDSDKYENSLSNHGLPPHGSGHIAVKAPFKPSLFLGASHESSAISGGFDGHKPSHGVATQYLPPTSDGYDYPPPSALYGTRSHAHGHSGHVDSAVPAHDLESVYLPPTQSSYGPPSLPEESYLPPHH